jgi:hypothetical protein
MDFSHITTDLNVPAGISPESSGVYIIDHVVKSLVDRFVFGYNDYQDTFQQGRLFAIELLSGSTYNEDLPMEKYLYRHVLNRFINYRRDKYFRNIPPCHKCPLRDNSAVGCSAYADKMDCDPYREWSSHTESKRSLMNGSHEYIDNTAPSPDTESGSELESLIDTNIPSELRSDYLRMRDGVSVPEMRRQKVRAAVRKIVGEFYGT